MMVLSLTCNRGCKLVVRQFGNAHIEAKLSVVDHITRQLIPVLLRGK
jgi:hypothetical protein